MNAKRIAILGDSWGVPNYYGGVGSPHDHHIEWLLKSIGGHVVTNFSKNGGSNIETLERLYDAFVIDYRCDLVIWFHTEPIRDIFVEPSAISPYSLLELSNKKAVTSYKFAQQVRYNSDCKWFVIGGQAPINKELFDKFKIADFVKYDWRSELAGKNLPETPALARKNFLESKNWIDPIEVKEKWVDIHLQVQNELMKSNMFPDNAHPGTEAQQQLFEYINKNILGNL